MIDIIALFFLCKKIGILATQKGLKPRTWKGYTILAWFVAEIFGIMLAMTLYGQETSIKENLLGIVALGLVCAYGGYLFIKATLSKKPDSLEEEISNIGVDDLQPPRK